MSAIASSKGKQVVLFGVFGTGNFGNDGSLESMFLFLRRTLPQQPLLCICTGPETVTATLGIDAVPIYYQPKGPSGPRIVALAKRAMGRVIMWFRAIRHLRRAKAIIVPGMGVLDDFAVSPFGWPLDLMTWFVIARLMGAKVILANIGAGPIRHPLSRVFLRTAARMAHFRSFRDANSRSFTASIGIDVSKDRVVPDLTFGMPTPPRSDAGGATTTIGVGVMTYSGWQKVLQQGDELYEGYIAKIATFCRRMMAEGHYLRLIIGDETDNQAAEDVLANLRSKDPAGANKFVAFEPSHSMAEVMRQMAQVDVVVATRFHNVVCAIKMVRPTISIGYQDKNDSLLAAVGLSDFCQHIERLDIDRLYGQMTELLRNRAAYEARIQETLERFRAELSAQEEALSALIEDPSR